MSNMSYCRFENTLRDLQDCADALHAELENNTEKRFRLELIHLCALLVEDSGLYSVEETNQREIDEYPEEAA